MCWWLLSGGADYSFIDRDQKLISIWTERDITSWKEVSGLQTCLGLLSCKLGPFLVEQKDWTEGRAKGCSFFQGARLGYNGPSVWARLEFRLLWACCASLILSPLEFSVACSNPIFVSLLHAGCVGSFSLIIRLSQFKNHSQYSLFGERICIFCTWKYNLWP